MTDNQYHGLLFWFFLSAVKFFYAPASIYSIGGYSYWETMVIALAGGWSGVLVFYFSGKIIFSLWNKMTAYFMKKKKKKFFTRTNRMIVRIKNHRLGLIFLAFLTPCLLSIPLGSFIAAKYFKRKKETIPVLLIAVTVWGFALTTMIGYFNIRF